MYHRPALSICVFCLVFPVAVIAQTHDPRVDQLTKEVAQLKTAVAEQDGRIAELEKMVKALLASAEPPPKPIPSPTPAWLSPSNWNQIRKGMSEAQVVDILGEPTSVDTSIDVRTLLYQPDSQSTVRLQGSVTLTDDRVTAMTPPAFPPPR